MLQNLRESLEVERVQSISVHIRKGRLNYYADVVYTMIYTQGQEVTLYTHLNEKDTLAVGSTDGYTDLKTIKISKEEDLNITIDMNYTLNEGSIHTVTIQY